MMHAIAETLQINWEIEFRKLNQKLDVHIHLLYFIKILVYNFAIFAFEEKFEKLYLTGSQGTKLFLCYSVVLRNPLQNKFIISFLIFAILDIVLLVIIFDVNYARQVNRFSIVKYRYNVSIIMSIFLSSCHTMLILLHISR